MINSNTRHTNLDFLTSFTGGDKDKMRKYVRMFINNSTQLGEEIDQAVLQNDFSGIRIKVHALKSQLSYMGANELSKEAANIENEIEQSGKGMIERLNTLLSCIKDARAELESQINLM